MTILKIYDVLGRTVQTLVNTALLFSNFNAQKSCH